MISDIIYKYLSNSASEQEVKTLFEWIETSEENKKHFVNLKKCWAIAPVLESKSNDSVPVISIKPKTKSKAHLKYIAVFLALLGLGKLAFDFTQQTQKPKEIVLELSNGREEYITNDKETGLVNEKGVLIAKKLPNQIIYFGKVKDEAVAYNTLKIPYGKTYQLTLSDGTVVTLNSGTSLRYPEQFGVNGNRNVYLIGEAFFEVAKDKQHPFIVNANEVDIKVLGTKFNVSAYPETATVNSVLVEGSIQMFETANSLNSVVLKQNQMATWQKKSKKMVVEEVDSAFYSAWTKGELAFNDTPFSTITKIIERTYDVEIINKNSDLDKQNFTGTIKINESTVENILELLKRDTPFDFTVNKNKITITN
jgi:transmembrane sensor